ncbi:MAG: DUF4159 domain-containing protein [Gemmatimonadetes bacterium]|nr:DUF4159 domain-containing protein [Gemmatimonadota bacterium]
MTRTHASRLALLLFALAATAPSAHAQWRGHREGGYAPIFAPDTLFDRGFVFCRLMYDRDRYERGGIGWETDYPYAELNFMSRVAELTTAVVSFEEPERPTHFVVRATDEALFRCPFIMASDTGTMHLSDAEVDGLRKYLLKGGFFWVDDFWGTAAWMQFSEEIGRVLPPREFPIVDIPLSDPIFQTPYVLPKMPQITSLQNWLRTGQTSERGADSEFPHLRAIRDHAGRVMVLMTHNTDVGDAWEREGDEYEFFFKFAHDGYALGINALIYMLAH